MLPAQACGLFAMLKFAAPHVAFLASAVFGFAVGHGLHAGRRKTTVVQATTVVLVTLVMLLALVAPLRAQDAAKIEIVPMLGHSVAVFSVAFSSDRGRVLSGGDKTVKLWDSATGVLIRTFDIGQSRAAIRERPLWPCQLTHHARLGARPGGTP